MSQFLMVIPSGWQEMQNSSAFIEQHTEATILDLIARNEGWGAIEALMQDGGYIAPDAAITDFRMFSDGDVTRIWYQLG